MKKKARIVRQQQKLVPYLLYRDVGKALKWLERAFGFREFGERFTGADGAIQHSAMEIAPGGEIFMVGCPGAKAPNPKSLKFATTLMHINVTKIDKHYARAKKIRPKVIRKIENTFYGDRQYAVADPEGHQWYFAEHVRDVSSAEIQAEMKKH